MNNIWQYGICFSLYSQTVRIYKIYSTGQEEESFVRVGPGWARLKVRTKSILEVAVESFLTKYNNNINK